MAETVKTLVLPPQIVADVGCVTIDGAGVRVNVKVDPALVAQAEKALKVKIPEVAVELNVKIALVVVDAIETPAPE